MTNSAPSGADIKNIKMAAERPGRRGRPVFIFLMSAPEGAEFVIISSGRPTKTTFFQKPLFFINVGFTETDIYFIIPRVHWKKLVLIPSQKNRNKFL